MGSEPVVARTVLAGMADLAAVLLAGFGVGADFGTTGTGA